ncbi:MAG: hypothetical protein L6R42_005373 [Xanthoria sp. 1 TBL-2021]|nr:MAG: hypothetical protein L6R42_005373 [Xanthoria sp. 1 TBL-2021]
MVSTPYALLTKLRDKEPNYAANIAHEFNLKLGGANQTLPNDKFESTHRLCYLSGRSTKAISLYPPAYFADLLCERDRMYLYKVFNAAQFDPATAPVNANGDFDLNQSPWLRGVHPAIKDSMFYI